MSDIYNVNSWAASTVYKINDIVLYNNYYYYALIDHTSSSSFTTDSANWGGVLTYKGKTLPHFIWKTSYGYNLDIKPKVKSISFEGYTQDISDGINNILLPLSLNFDERDLQEYTAINHFLSARAGYQRFFYTAPAPFNIPKIFVCQNWSPRQNFYNNYSISAQFEERSL